ncbi:MAG TPA: YihY/virulence factor BrkB family protein [Methylibium sp.]|uniref:YihY/virulence factor BrkB family protein n=1 Tax=Methylibium sp. TaxID=2067992 RepID=UPI002DBB0D1A|nr:YihY/virulence factor BrkB family protein [Methylibium sp.]HEU4459102.1 YihY/virulence factor BrkB family protein [Methylibium sp.]
MNASAPSAPSAPIAAPVSAVQAPHADDAMPAWLDRAARRLPPRLAHTLRVAVLAAIRWVDVDGSSLGASIAFFTVFALAPLLVITIAVVGTVFGPEAARGQIVAEIAGLVGSTAAEAIQSLIANAWRAPAGGVSAAIGIATLLIGASTVFAALRAALNAVARITPTASPVGTFLRVRLRAFALLLGFGFLAIVSLLVSATAAGIASTLTHRFEFIAPLVSLVDFALTVTVLTVAFAALLRWLPDRPPSKRAAWLSAIVASGLFAVGKTLIGLYLGRASFVSSYGAAGSFVVLLMWVYYSSQILLYGAAVGRIDDELRRQPQQPAHA